MSEESKTPNALTRVDGFSDTGDTEASPIRGIGFRFKEGKEGEEYIAYSEPFPVKGRTFAAIDKTDGWQKLAEGVPPEYLMRKPGQPRPPRPHVDEKDWPLDFNGKPEHPWKLTQYLYLLDTATGEISTFWSNTTGGKIAFRDLSDQVNLMRDMNPGKIPVALIALDRTMFQTGFGGKKARPLFRILGYKLRDQLNPQNLLTDETKAPPTLAEEMGDKIPFNDPAPTLDENTATSETAAPATSAHKPAAQKPQMTKRGVQKVARR